ncbi:GTP cyclohydrolase I FolE [Thalassotalea ponticola]|uniref:GTP cyclohydrolase I FolE n=1 Tax=Thalassotalea ponticola TaxID=1523392 RepID=UPI0025B31CD7|nr:GTP cyclohydrolase I FolE [Thalassotalea ponticola]MDN3651923.1 GTP cyclohydrolase I FolE [Thalassotalea ponticola]
MNKVTEQLKRKNNDTLISDEALLVQKALIKAGLETPVKDNSLTSEQKYQRIKASYVDICQTLGLDLNDDSLQETPHRIAKMFIGEIFSGLDYQNFPKVTTIDNKMKLDEMVMVRDIDVISTCEHHFVTIDGTAKVAYIPSDKVIGLSKINRIVRFFAQRPQVQERLTQQILIALKTLLNTEHVAVTINATHYCVKARGVMDSNSSTTTTALSGCFKDNLASRSEFLKG